MIRSKRLYTGAYLLFKRVHWMTTENWRVVHWIEFMRVKHVSFLNFLPTVEIFHDDWTTLKMRKRRGKTHFTVTEFDETDSKIPATCRAIWLEARRDSAQLKAHTRLIRPGSPVHNRFMVDAPFRARLDSKPGKHCASIKPCIKCGYI